MSFLLEVAIAGLITSVCRLNRGGNGTIGACDGLLNIILCSSAWPIRLLGSACGKPAVNGDSRAGEGSIPIPK